MGRDGAMTRGWFSDRLAVLVLPVLAVLLALSCSSSRAGSALGFEIERTYGQGFAVSFSLRVSKQRLSTAEGLSLVLETRAARGWSADLQEIPDSLGQFEVTERGKESRVLDRQGNLISTRRYTLEPFLPGAYVIPPLTVFFAEQGGGAPLSLSSEEIPIEVTSVLPTQLGEQDIEEISGPEKMPARRVIWVGIGIAALAGVGGILLYLRLRRLSPGAAEPEVAPWDGALKALEQLLSQRLFEQGKHRELYGAISDLARRYVEQRFRVRAPEQTTEEFLQQVQASEALSGYKPLLQDFLFHCDLVKFARYQPSGQEVEQTVRACRSFITGTIPEGTGP